MKELNKNRETIISEKESTGIKEKRLNALKGNYIKPEISCIIFKDNVEGECSDMASAAYCCAVAEIIRIDSLPLEYAFGLPT